MKEKNNGIVKNDGEGSLFSNKGDVVGSQQFGTRATVQGDNNTVKQNIRQTTNYSYSSSETRNTHVESHDDHSVTSSTDSHDSYVSNVAYSYDSHNQSYTSNSYTSIDDHSYTDNSQHISASFTDAKQVAMFGIMFGGAGQAILMGLVVMAILVVVFMDVAILIGAACLSAGLLTMLVRGGMRYIAYQKAKDALAAEQTYAYQMLQEQRAHEIRLAEISRPIGSVNITINASQPVGIPADPEALARNLLASQSAPRVIDSQRQEPKMLTGTVEESEPIEMPTYRRQKVKVRR